MTETSNKIWIALFGGMGLAALLTLFATTFFLSTMPAWALPLATLVTVAFSMALVDTLDERVSSVILRVALGLATIPFWLAVLCGADGLVVAFLTIPALVVYGAGVVVLTVGMMLHRIA
jgi:hypothetical protein